LKLYCATTNRGKLREFQKALEDSEQVQVLPGLASIAPCEETGATFEENAVQKALYYSKFCDGYLFVDDSGLEVPALANEPGVRSARYAQDAGFEPRPEPGSSSRAALTPDERNNLYLLNRLSGSQNRAARYHCVLALARAGTVLLTADGSVDGQILTAPRGTGGFGYDPLFFLPELNRTMAEISLEEKHTLSHRGRAFRAMLPQLPKLQL